MEWAHEIPLDRLICARLLFALTDPGTGCHFAAPAASGSLVAHRGRPR